MLIRQRKLKKDLSACIDPVITSIYEQDVGSLDIHRELRYVYERIKIKQAKA